MKKVYTALLLILLAAMFSVGVYSLADYDATGSVSEKREFVKPEFSVKSLLDGTYIPALEQYYSDTFPGRESLLQANRTLNKFYYYSGSGEDSVLILNQSDSAAQGGESLDAVQKANGQTPQQEPQTPAERPRDGNSHTAGRSHHQLRGRDRQSGQRHGSRRAHDLAHHAERRRILLA